MAYYTEALDYYVLQSLHEVNDMSAEWPHRYNLHRPYEAIGQNPPVEGRVKPFPDSYF